MEKPIQTKEGLSSKLKYAEHAPRVWEALGKLERTGWVKREVKNPETVQEHTIALRDLVISISESLTEFSENELNDILNMLEVHDWPEVIVGDQITVTDDTELRKKLKEEKFTAEEVAMTEICSGLGVIGKEIFSSWLRFEQNQDSAAAFAQQVDKYQAIEKAFEYEGNGESVSTQEFIRYAEKGITHPVLVASLTEIKMKLDVLNRTA